MVAQGDFFNAQWLNTLRRDKPNIQDDCRRAMRLLSYFPNSIRRDAVCLIASGTPVLNSLPNELVYSEQRVHDSLCRPTVPERRDSAPSCFPTYGISNIAS